MNTAVVLKSHGWANSYLRRKALPLGKYRRTDDRGVSGIYQRLAAHNYKNASRLRVAWRTAESI